MIADMQKNAKFFVKNNVQDVITFISKCMQMTSS